MIGHGTYSEVFKGYDLINSHEIAVRNVLNTAYKDWFNTIYHHKSLSEKETPYIVNIYSIHPDKPTAFLEMFDNDLSKLSAKTLSNQQILNLILQIANGIKSVHSENLIFRDIKPENILYKKDVDGNTTLSHCDLESVYEIFPIKPSQETCKYIPIDAFNSIMHVDRKKVDSWSFGLTLLLFVSESHCHFNAKQSTELFM